MQTPISTILEQTISIAVSMGAKEIWLFGSYAHGTEKVGSDVDIAVDQCSNLNRLKRILNENIRTLKTINPVLLPQKESLFRSEILNGKKIYDKDSGIS